MSKIAILDLVFGLILPNRRHLDYVSSDCDSGLFEELRDHHWILFHRSLHQKGEVGWKRVSPPLSLSFPPGISPFSKIDGMLKE